MAEIVLATINARFIHAAFGLRYLKANLGNLESRATIIEFDLTQRPVDMAERILALRPRILGLGVYIWNADLSRQLVSILKRVQPELTVVLGGPEVSYEADRQEIVALGDYVISGEADLVFASLCRAILEGSPPPEKLIAASLPDLAKIRLPYYLYDDNDTTNRVVYVEASRGCPFTCEFCLSSLDIPVRQFNLDELLIAFEDLLARGVRQFKFVDRTFNLNLAASTRILEFFLERLRPGLFLHFEMIPDRLPEQLRGVIARFPAGALQFEVGVQSLNPEVSERIKRKQNVERLADNLRFLRDKTQVHVHADLIAGLPGETMESFARGFNELAALGPQEIQVGILKRLRGTPIVRHDSAWGMVYQETPPYEILQTSAMAFGEMQEIRRFSRHWDLVVNSGNFLESAPLIWKKSGKPFQGFQQFSQYLQERFGRQHGIALTDLLEALFLFLTERAGWGGAEVADTLWRDYQRGGRSDRPAFLRPFILDDPQPSGKARPALKLKRQARRLAAPPVL